ncbi:MAG: methyltransferase domain-containing protein [Hyphomicrobiaceae bacterium]|nr:methyltransferase domain-containing protein [Hyphomicrobiaceae bacterium]
MTTPSVLFDRRLLARRRARAARAPELPDFLLTRVAEDFAERLAIVRREFPVAVNLGAHHGVIGRALAPLANVGDVIDVELAPELIPPGARAVAADEEALPFAEGSVDLVVSGLSLQLVNDLPGALIQICRALKADGLFLGALLGGDSLKELREAWLIAEDEICGGASPRVAPFADVRDLGGLLQRAGFALPVVDSDSITVTYPSALHLMREIKAMGASNMLQDRRRVPVTRGLLLRVIEIYADRFSRPDGRIAATFEIISMTAWAPHESQPKPLRPGSAEQRLADVLGAKKSKDFQ